MKKILVIILGAVGLIGAGAFLAGMITNPLASNHLSSTSPQLNSPIVVTTDGAQVSIIPTIGSDGTLTPVTVNVGYKNMTKPFIYEEGTVRTIPAVERRVAQTTYEPGRQRSTRIVRADDEPVKVSSKRRSWEKEALIIGGSAAAGAGIGAAAGGKKGAAIGAVSGGVAGLVYDLATRH